MKRYTVLRNGLKYSEADSMAHVVQLSNRIRREDAEGLSVPSRIAVCDTRDLLPCDVGQKVIAVDPLSEAGLLVAYAQKLPRNHDARCLECTAGLQEGAAGFFQCIRFDCRLFGAFVDSEGNPTP